MYADIVMFCMRQAAIAEENIGPPKAATIALEHNADIAKMQEWLGHASISTTRVYDQRGSKPEDLPTFRVAYA